MSNVMYKLSLKLLIRTITIDIFLIKFEFIIILI